MVRDESSGVSDELQRTDAIRPFHLEWKILVSLGVALDALDHRHSRQILNKNHRSRLNLLNWVSYDGGEYQ